MKRYHIQSCVVIATLIVVCCSWRAAAQEGQADSAATEYITAPADTLVISTLPIPLVGSIDRTLIPSRIIADSVINMTDYKYIDDILTFTPGLYRYNFGSAGQLHGLSVNGIDGRGIAYMNDGILLNEPFSGIFNQNLYPTEAIDRIEIITGPESFLYGLNSTGGAINVISKSKKAIHPYSKIRYSESAYGYGYVDGLISQDIIRGLNITAGGRHSALDGRFDNSDYDAWNARFKMRYIINSKINLFFSEQYNQTQLGLNGGIDTTTPFSLWFEPIQARVRNTDSYEKLTRHDLQLGFAAKLFADSNAITTMTIYHSTSLREYRDEENRLSPNNIFVSQDHRSQWYGVKVTQHVTIKNYQLDIGAETESRGLIASSIIGQQLTAASNIFGRTSFSYNDLAEIAVFGRIDQYQSRTPLSYGSIVSLNPLPWIEVFGGFSRSFRFPTFQEMYWRDSVYTSAYSAIPPERHHLLEAGIRFSDHQTTTFELTLYKRFVHDALVLTPSQKDVPFRSSLLTIQQTMTLQGINAVIKTRIGMFYMEGSAQYLEMAYGGVLTGNIPKWNATGGLYFWDKLLDDKLELKTGVQGHIQSLYQGMEFNPQSLSFIPSTRQDLTTTGTSDFIIMAHIGSAYIHLVWENFLNRDYIYTPVYPMPERTLRFGVTWEFTD